MAHTTTMTHSIEGSAARTGEVISRITALGHRVLRYGLALVIGWIGMMKFTGYEAQGIEPLVAHSPLLGWMYSIWTVRQFAAGLGVVELSIAILIALLALVAKSICNWQCCCRAGVPDYAFVLVFNPRMGGESRWLSCSFGRGWTVSAKGRGPARGGDMVTGRSLEFMRRWPAVPPCLPARTV
jgi:hypothetical protein